MVLPEDAEPLPLSVNQEKGRNGEPPDLPDPSTDSLWTKRPAWVWALRGGPGPRGLKGGGCAESLAVCTSYLLPIDRRLLPFSFRLLLVDARRKVTLWGGEGAVGQCCPLYYPVPLPPQLQAFGAGLSCTHPRSRNFRRVFLSRPMVGLAGSGGLASRLSSFREEGGKQPLK